VAVGCAGAAAGETTNHRVLGWVYAFPLECMGQRLCAATARTRRIEGRNVAIEYRWAEGRNERYTEIAAEFVQLKVDVIVTAGASVVAAKQATSAIPTVFAVAAGCCAKLRFVCPGKG